MTIYDFSAQTIDGTDKSLEDYKGKVLLIVNTASKCGFTPQFEGLQQLYEKYQEEGFEVLGFPCNQFKNQELGSNEETQAFCQKNYGVSFQMFSRIDVNGPNAHPLYNYLTTQQSGLFSKKIKWNFTKFLIDRSGNVLQRYAPQTKPSQIETAIQNALKAPISL
ncbi:glutathione peroxidase [Pullulanibacillus camelliae]|uniref:Glutathione peroxidase n=1 Tax=Pullulanibacillus camelliae TaxID=1707096 RepID=A0A8J2VMS3_9BACL|nr:glutathione peroxidase [Pullulanibacillus camelliae]GGE33822.1 glutathione peroxidase [Pullulanibacillus camelliae]